MLPIADLDTTVNAAATTITVIDEKWAAKAVTPPLAKAAMAPAAQAMLVDPRIADGVAAMLAAAPEHDPAPNRQNGLQAQVYGADAAAAKFSKDFTEAKIPSCGGANPLKFQPSRIGPVGFSGLFAAPFLVVAALRGKCLMH